MQELIRQLLGELGEDPSREGLRQTPKRVEKALRFLTSGYDADIDTVLNDALFTVEYSEMVIVRDIDFYSLCEHHLLPFFGKCHVAYIPTTKVIGLSKIPRIVDVFSRRLQVQERLTSQIAKTIQDAIKPLGVAVVVEATHLCMSMRGVEKQNSFAVTSSMTGVTTKLQFCDVMSGRDPSAGVIVRFPEHKGPVTLTFDLHNRHTYSEEQVKANRAFSRYTATIGVLTMDNTLVSRAVVQNEFRKVTDFVDRIGGGAGPAGI